MLFRDSVVEGWDTFRREPLPFVLTTLIYGLAANALGGASSFAFPRFGGALVSVLTGPCLGGLALMVMQARRGEPVDINEAFRPWRRPGDYLVVGLALAAGALLFVVGAVLTYTLFMFAPLLVARGKGYAAALGRSRDLVIEHWGEVLPLAGIVLVASLLSIWLTWSLGLLVVVPVATAATCGLLARLESVEAERELRSRRPPSPAADASAPPVPPPVDAPTDRPPPD